MKNATPLFEAVTELGFPVRLDWSRRSASPKLAEIDESERHPAPVCEAEQFGLFAVCPVRHVMLYRGVVARHSGAGQWRVDWLDGSSDGVYLGSFLVASIIMFRGFVDARAQSFPGSVLPVPPAPLGESRADGGFFLSVVEAFEVQNQSETPDRAGPAGDNFPEACKHAC